MHNSNTAKISSRSRLLDLVDKELLIEILKAFTRATGLTANIVDVKGRSIFNKKDAQKNCTFCQPIWKLENKKGIHRCADAYARAGKQAALFNEPYIFRCPGGLIEWAAPLIVEGEHLGSIICGQVLMWEPEEFFWIELENMNRSLTDDFEPLYNAAKELQVVSGDKVQGAANLLAVVANHIVSTAWERRRQEKEIALQRLLLNEEIQTRKSLEKKLNSQSLRFFLEKEKVLAGKIRLGDYVESVKIFKVMLSDIYNDQYDTSQDSLTSIKGRVFELAVIVSRAVIELGLEPGVASESNTTFMQLLEQCTNIEEINTVAIRMLETLLEKTKNLGNSKNRLIVEGIKGYVRSHFKENLNLDMIAESVCLSPYYASRIFKESQNMTIMEYVLEVKMHEAKKLLSNPRYKIDEIARDLGYVDPSYFSKVFRRKTGLSPTQFRNHQ